jgi:NADH:ubiquinone oxidoreductase subunit 6 (subunit J)/NADH:ubiquinone oxidoreductase subunit K
MIQALVFYLFAGIMVASAVMVISARNPVHSVLFLILAFFNAAGLFVLMGAEFLAMILVIVYVGAVAVLFLFVVMMLDIDFAQLRQGFLKYAPIGAMVGLVLLAELVLVGGAWIFPGLADPRSRQDHQHACARPRALYRLHLCLPGVRADPAGRDDRRHRADSARARRRSPPEDLGPAGAHARTGGAGGQGAAAAGGMTMTIGLEHYLTVAAILFTLGIFGIFLNRKNVIVILMSVELMLLAVNINLVAFSTHLGDLVGQVFALMVLTVAAAEAAIGLAILVVYFRNRGSIAVEDINLMKG